MAEPWAAVPEPDPGLVNNSSACPSKLLLVQEPLYGDLIGMVTDVASILPQLTARLEFEETQRQIASEFSCSRKSFLLYSNFPFLLQAYLHTA